MSVKIYTIGVYNSTEETFFGTLVAHGITLFCDIRQRRGVRGAQYSYVNSQYLQAKLAELHIEYLYIKDLAPTKEIRQKQWEADKLHHETKKLRRTLGDVFCHEYCVQKLEPFDMSEMAADWNRRDVSVVFFCVEEHAEACHRSLVAKKLAQELGQNETDIIHL